MLKRSWKSIHPFCRFVDNRHAARQQNEDENIIFAFGGANDDCGQEKWPTAVCKIRFYDEANMSNVYLTLWWLPNFDLLSLHNVPLDIYLFCVMDNNYTNSIEKHTSTRFIVTYLHTRYAKSKIYLYSQHRTGYGYHFKNYISTYDHHHECFAVSVERW